MICVKNKLCYTALQVFILAGAVYANNPPANNVSAAAKKIAPPPTEISEKFVEAQFKYGVYCRETLKDDKQSYFFLELAAEQNYRPAWLYLADCYFARHQEHYSYLLWSKLCLIAAEKIKADADTEFKIGLIEAYSGNLDGFKHWMKLAAAKGHQKAAKQLTDTKTHAKIAAMHQRLIEMTKPDAFKQAVDSNNRKIRQATGTTAQEVLAEITGKTSVSKTGKMIRIQLPPELRIPKWNYSSHETDAFIAKKLMADRHGDMRWISDEFIELPIWENLLYPSPTIRTINITHAIALSKNLDAAGFKRCSWKEIRQLIKPFMDPDMPESFYSQDEVWSLGNNLYFRIHCDTSGTWCLYDYQFFLHKNGKSIRVETFPKPPETADAALIAGIVQNNSDCWNNLAVKYADGEMDQVFSCDDEAEPILKELVKRRHVIGTYNLAVYYQNRNQHAEAEKYFALAKEFAAKNAAPKTKP